MKRRKVSKREAEEILRENASRISKEDIKEVLEKQEEIESRFKGPLKRFLRDAKELLSLLKDYASGEYRRAPFFTVAAITAALLYVLNPFDLIPDFIPVVGQVDDALVVSLCLYLIEKDLKRYREWKEQKDETVRPPR